MKIWIHRYTNASAYSHITIDERILDNVNAFLAQKYVVADKLSETPQIESVEVLEILLKEYNCDDEHTNDYNILFKDFIKEDGTMSANAYYESLYEIVYDWIIDYLYDEAFELDKYDTIDCDVEIEE